MAFSPARRCGRDARSGTRYRAIDTTDPDLVAASRSASRTKGFDHGFERNGHAA
jgi:hypothetical protein